MDGEDEAGSDEFLVRGRAKQSAILFGMLVIGFPLVFLTFSIVMGMDILIVLMAMGLFSPIMIVALIGLIFAVRQKTIVIDDRAICYQVGSKTKWKIPLKKIEKIRLFMGGGKKMKVPIIRIEGAKGSKSISGEKVSYGMIRSTFEELQKRLRKKGLAVLVEDDIGKIKQRWK